jgi:hypothetical protein
VWKLVWVDAEVIGKNRQLYKVKTEVMRYSETSEHLTTTRCRNAKYDHQLTNNRRKNVKNYQF